MPLERAFLWASVSTRHLLESRLHLLAAIETMSDIEGFHCEYLRAVEIREALDELFMAVDVKSADLQRQILGNASSPTAEG
jgi:hypothetical protein